MKPITTDIECKGYAVKADIYEGSKNGALLLSLIGRTSHRTKKHTKIFYQDWPKNLALHL